MLFFVAKQCAIFNMETLEPCRKCHVDCLHMMSHFVINCSDAGINGVRDTYWRNIEARFSPTLSSHLKAQTTDHLLISLLGGNHESLPGILCSEDHFDFLAMNAIFFYKCFSG